MITQYHRPATMDEALDLLAGRGTFVLAGGTMAVAAPQDAAAVDIQALGLDGIFIEDSVVRIGAMTSLADVAVSPEVPDALRTLAHREAPNTIRNAATVGGTIGANDPESEFLAGLVAYRTRVSIAHAGSSSEHGIAELLENPAPLEGGIITEIGFDAAGSTAAHRTGRTPMDRPIVMVVGHRSPDGHIRLGVTGVSSRVIEMSPGHTAELDPPSDFRGTAPYRKSLATVLTKRVLADLSGGGI